MRLLSTCTLLLSLSAAVPAVCQQMASNSKPPAAAVSTPGTPTTATAADPATTSIDYAALREDLARQNKALADQLNAQRSINKKNQDLLHASQRLDAANKHMQAEQKKAASQNADLERRGQALKANVKPDETASTN